MVDLLYHLFDSSGFTPRRSESGWNSEVIWLHEVSDAALGLASLSIALLLGWSIRRNRHVPFHGLVWLLAAFLLLCGCLHLTDVTTSHLPVYRLSGLLKLAAAVVSWVTVIALVLLLPRVFALRGPQVLKKESSRRRRVEADLRRTQAALEYRVRERTEELAQANAALRQEIQQRQQVEEDLRKANDLLERRVAERTATVQRHAQVLAESEQALRQQARTLRSILDSIGDGVLVADREGRLLLFNPAAERILGVSVADAPPDERSKRFGLYQLDGRTPYPLADLPLTRAVRGEATDDADLFIRPPERSEGVYVTVSGRPLIDEAGTVRGGVVVFRDITSRMRTEAALRDSEERFRNAFDHAPNGMWIVSLDGRWLKVNRALCDIVGRTAEEMLATTFQAITHPDDLAPDVALAQRLRDGGLPCYHMEKRFLHRDGHVVWILLSAGVVRNEQGQPLYFVGHFQDISHRKAAEARLQASLQEKELLLKEIHHRVKNNLQVISTLLALQSEYAPDGPIVELFRASQNRVKTMALIHERLYHSRDLARIHFADYACSLADDLFRSYRVDTDRLCLETDIADVPLMIDQAIPCGLIINELISNCVKHAFPNETTGAIRLDLASLADGRVRLRVSDNGVGLPERLDWRRAETLGMQLIAALAEQLRGSMEIVRQGGTTVAITFTAREPGDGPRP